MNTKVSKNLENIWAEISELSVRNWLKYGLTTISTYSYSNELIAKMAVAVVQLFHLISRLKRRTDGVRFAGEWPPRPARDSHGHIEREQHLLPGQST